MPRQTRPLVAGRFQHRQPLKVRPFWRAAGAVAVQDAARDRMGGAQRQAVCMASVGKTFIAVEPMMSSYAARPSPSPIEIPPNSPSIAARTSARNRRGSTSASQSIRSAAATQSGSQPVDDGA